MTAPLHIPAEQHQPLRFRFQQYAERSVQLRSLRSEVGRSYEQLFGGEGWGASVHAGNVPPVGTSIHCNKRGEIQ